MGIFAEPVTEAIAPGYFSLITSPMDFRTLRENVRLGKYTAWRVFTADLELIYLNAMAYNPQGTVYHTLAGKTLEQSRKWTEKARAAGMSPAAKRAKMAHVASIRGAMYKLNPVDPQLCNELKEPGFELPTF